ncbi:cell division protein SepF [Actinomyces vulturis]|uniref:cell division protein SepF n=1 Tax=Actinomyces vulturis TaxID=1857645 RepID=UPI00082C348C|nr:cell division protein SepF [Actinomyces vulturis]
MSALRKMSSILGYAEPSQDEYLDEYTEGGDDYYDDAPLHAVDEEMVYEEEAPAPDLRRIVTVKPSSYNEARLIGEAFRDGVPVIVNLTDMTESDARRMVDFSAGLVFGLRGSIERVTPRVFLLTPATVEIEGATAPATAGFFAQN